MTVLLFFSSVVYGDIWKPAKRLSYTAGSSDFPAIAVSGLSIFVVWQDTTGDEGIYFKRSIDRGVNWKPTRKLSTSESGYHPDIASEGSSVYVVWVDYSMETYNYEIYFRRSVDGGINWKTEISLTESLSMNPVMAIDGSNIYVVWSQYFGAPKEPEIYFKRSVNRGVNWTSDKGLTKNSGVSWHPAIAVDGSKVYVVWMDNIPGNEGLHFKRSEDGGATWTGYKRLREMAGVLAIFPDIAVNGSRIYVVWPDGKPGNLEAFFKIGVVE